jgi:hypothetical protein
MGFLRGIGVKRSARMDSITVLATRATSDWISVVGKTAILTWPLGSLI